MIRWLQHTIYDSNVLFFDLIFVVQWSVEHLAEYETPNDVRLTSSTNIGWVWLVSFRAANKALKVSAVSILDAYEMSDGHCPEGDFRHSPPHSGRL